MCSSDLERVRVYNTCAGSFYGRAIPGTVRVGSNVRGEGRYEDYHAFMNHAGDLARELLPQYDRFAAAKGADRAKQLEGFTRAFRGQFLGARHAGYQADAGFTHYAERVRKALKLKLQAYFRDEPLRKRSVEIWLVPDHPNRPIVRADAQMKIGQVRLELMEFVAGLSAGRPVSGTNPERSSALAARSIER